VFSNFDKYKKELETEVLVWGPCHTEQFWRENVYRFEERDFSLINKLFYLVKNSTEPLTVAVALFDLGEFARNYPNSKIFFDRHDSKGFGKF
jgi:V-type H+-transporting ATPase subunit H